MLWFKRKKPDPEKVSADIQEEIALADPAIFTDQELDDEIQLNLESGYFKPDSVFTDFHVNPDNRPVARPYVEHAIRTQHPYDRNYWSLALNPFLKEK